MGKLEGKSALVTGAGRGIGRSIALKLASEGARVVVNDLDEGPANTVVKEIADLGGEAVAVPGSVTADGFADRFVSAAVDGFGGIDIIINNAGYTWDSVIQKMTDDQWHAIVDLHLKAPFDILRAAQPVISAAAKKEKAEGRTVHRKVVNISSVAGAFGNVGQANYSSAKAGVIGLTKSLAKEWGRYNVNVNCVAFGFITTRLTEASATAGSTINVEGREIKVGVNPQLLEAMKTAIPLGRPGTPDEAAGSVVMLTYPEADYVSGQLLVAGGGLEG
ncbi:SDR family NAD(P)-dependent oxidoreductase [Actinomadura sp. 7K507]|uniref:SDR family NAD(P)-dependent oxidoreductase n=1 Tax=Actinomadura sp. 7K507 TaxID=2530365 RepID=UPI0010496D05|nr:SDR family NAD(P)-dependent oxidoreductase [Actinomadura sp. 7K507]TDC88528.1 SDR family oxidoreductase [Actinomadura sp. 7K507]